MVNKYAQFLEAFPTVVDLAQAPLADVLITWQGLGYNRRARFLHEAAKQLVSKNGAWKRADLLACKGIGPNTAAAVLAYAYNQPEVFIETNIRSVYLHHFFEGQRDVSDKQILELVEQTLDTLDPREWYWALMDYGSNLKKTHGNPNTASQHYSVQTRFEGSKRQVRGKVLRQLSGHTKTLNQLRQNIVDERLEEVLAALSLEKMITKTARGYRLG